MLMKLVAKKTHKKKQQSLQTFLSGSMTGFYGLFSLVGLHLLFSLKRTTKGKYMNFYASFPLKTTTTTTTTKKLQGAEHGLCGLSQSKSVN